MKILTQTELDDANKVFFTNGIRGAIGCTAAALGATFFIHRYTRFGRSLTLPFKAFFVTSAATAGFVINGEHALIEYDRAQHASQPIEKKIMESVDLTSLSRAKNFISDYRYHIVAASWLGGMSLAGLHLYRKRYLTVPQKLVEARVYAQAITLGSMVAVAIFSAGATNDPKRKQKESKEGYSNQA